MIITNFNSKESMKKEKSKKFILISSVLLFSLFILTGCGSKTATPASGQNSQNQTPQSGQVSQRRGMPDYGQPARPADIRGIVKSITGNQASIILMAAPVGGKGRASSTSATSSTSSSNTPSISLSGATGAARGGAGGGFGGGRQGGGAGGPGGAGGTTDRTAMIDQIKKLSTGEADITIPVGIQMLKSSTNSTTNKREMVEASLSDITADKFITIWLNQSVTDKKIAEFVLIN
jgi:hypothetical protein